MTQVCEHKCNQCLFTKNRIVDKSRVKEILDECLETGSFFVCHKATIKNTEVVCKGFYDKYGSVNGFLRVCQRQGWLKFVKPEEIGEVQP